MSSIQVAGSFANYVPSGTFLGNVSLDISGRTFLRNDTLINGNLFVVSDASFNSKLSVGGDVSLNSKLYVNGNTSLKNTTFGDVFPNPTKSLTITGTTTDLITYTLTQNTGQAPVTSNPWTPTRVNIPANNPYGQIVFTIPFDLSVRKTDAGAVSPGTLTVTYNSITFTVSKNGVARTITSESYNLGDFTAGGSRTWGTTSAGTSDSHYFWSYWGYFSFTIPIDTWNATADYYDITITMNATASHANGGTWAVRSVGLGQTVLPSTQPFTQTRAWFAPQAPTVPFFPTYVAPSVSQESTTGMTVASPSPLYFTNGGDATYYANNSLLFKSGTGFWTAQSNSNYYYQSPTDSYLVVYGDQAGNQFLNFEFSPATSTITSIANTLNLNSDDSVNIYTSATGDVNIGAQNCTINTTNEINNQISTVDRLTITDTTITINPTTQILAEISGTDKLTITSTETTLDPNNSFNMMPTATIIQNVSATVPSGFLYCNGDAVNRTGIYARLFASIGTTFGVGNGSTTFNVPNFQGAFLRGAGTQTVGGIAQTASAVGTVQNQALQDHKHTYSDMMWWDTDVGGGSGQTIFVAGTNFQVPGGDTVGSNGDGDFSNRLTKATWPSTAINPGTPAQQYNTPTNVSAFTGLVTHPMNYAVYYYIRY